MQTKKEIEEWYDEPDRWKYWENEDDKIRKEKILGMLNHYKDALDIGAGEGFITEDLPADDIYAIEWSDNAKSRLHTKIKVNIPDKKFELVVSCGTLYEQYDHKNMAEQIRKYAGKYVLIGGIKEWLKPYKFGILKEQIEFPYLRYTQQITLYEIAPQYRTKDKF